MIVCSNSIEAKLRRALGAWMFRLRPLWGKIIVCALQMCRCGWGLGVEIISRARLVWFRVIKFKWYGTQREQTCQIMSCEQKSLRADWEIQVWEYKGQYRRKDRERKRTTHNKNGFWNKFCEQGLPSCLHISHAELTLLCLVRRWISSIPDLSWCYIPSLNTRGAA